MARNSRSSGFLQGHLGQAKLELLSEGFGLALSGLRGTHKVRRTSGLHCGLTGSANGLMGGLAISSAATQMQRRNMLQETFKPLRGP